MHKPDFLDRFDRLVAFDAETTGKRTPDADFIRRQPFAWKPPGIIIEVGFVEMLRDGTGWRKGKTWCSLVNPDGPSERACWREAARRRSFSTVDSNRCITAPTLECAHRRS